MSIRAEHLNHIYGEGTAFEQYAFKGCQLRDRRWTVYRTDRSYRFRKIHADPASERTFARQQRRNLL